MVLCLLEPHVYIKMFVFLLALFLSWYFLYFSVKLYLVLGWRWYNSALFSFFHCFLSFSRFHVLLLSLFCIVIVAFFLLIFISFKVIVILNSIQDCTLLSKFMIFLYYFHLPSFHHYSLRPVNSFFASPSFFLFCSFLYLSKILYWCILILFLVLLYCKCFLLCQDFPLRYLPRLCNAFVSLFMLSLYRGTANSYSVSLLLYLYTKFGPFSFPFT